MKLFLELDFNCPRIVCDSCINCKSEAGISLSKYKSRGCCYYYPKFTLFELHKMAKFTEGFEVLNKILNNPGTKIYNYYIHSLGYFDKDGYDRYIKSDNKKLHGNIEDKSIFFRACPFVVDGKGCTIPPQFRTHVCNFFICEEIISMAAKDDRFKYYLREREKYSRWVSWENKSLEYLLKEKNLTLKDNLYEVFELLKKVDLMEYNFPELEEIIIMNRDTLGA
ncbi:hypothetical protein Q428_11735 [Fervidicella metallireducens AeB]|uniref:Uncharacterized protein n=1 Tax=Fervidicella metallireducens AeB TaxID=1403537 RepID=A0A017RSL2_9CLOT|nr:hypothetical protein [Fervidicella metallireducens]EYE87758.1 hypothetical protein Q428_11735 [Fervidicella metallireducens AeB]